MNGSCCNSAVRRANRIGSSRRRNREDSSNVETSPTESGEPSSMRYSSVTGVILREADSVIWLS